MRFFLPSNDKRNEFISHARDRYYRVILRGDRLNEEVSSVLYCLGAVRNRVDDKIYIVAVYREWNFPRRELNWNDGFRNRSFVRRFFFSLLHYDTLKYWNIVENSDIRLYTKALLLLELKIIANLKTFEFETWKVEEILN